VPVARWGSYVSLIFLIKNPGTKAIILDSLLSDIFLRLLDKHNPDFSHLFLNTGAHIQHHYMFNSDAYKGNLKNPDWYCKKGYDPLLKALIEYDKFLGRLMNNKNHKLIVATGLHQVPHKKITFYWRLKNHTNFINLIGVKDFSEILPRMSRDFLINFKTKSLAATAQNLLESFNMNESDDRFFKVDNRGKSLFVELIYSKDIKKNDNIFSKISKKTIGNIKNHVAFVAIKNGEHNGIGYLSSNFNLNLGKKINLKELKQLILDNI